MLNCLAVEVISGICFHLLFPKCFLYPSGENFPEWGRAFRLCETILCLIIYIHSTPGEGNCLFVCRSGSPYQEENRQRKHGCLMWPNSTDEELPT